MRFWLPLLLFAAVSVWAQPPAWVQKSNENAQLLIAIMARYSPEDAASEGVPGLDEQISTASPEQPERFRKDIAVARIELQKRLALEKDPLVRQDLEILIARSRSRYPVLGSERAQSAALRGRRRHHLFRHQKPAGRSGRCRSASRRGGSAAQVHGPAAGL